MKTSPKPSPDPAPGQASLFRRTPPAFALVFALAAAATLANLPTPVARASTLTASDGAAGDGFGFSVSLFADGGSALVGAYLHNSKGTESGAAYYYKGLDGKSGTVNETVKLLVSDGVEYDWFGRSVSLSGNNALICADQDDTYSGAAYYYHGLDQVSGNTTTETVKLITSSGYTYGNYFGLSVSLSGNNALVGSYNGFTDYGAGAAYYYKELAGKNGTVYEDVHLFASDGAADGQYDAATFGNSVSLSGDNALVGAPAAGNNGGNSGSAYYYKDLNNVDSNTTEHEFPEERNATYETVKLLASDGAANDHFGESVSLSADSALVGAVFSDDNGKTNSGSAYYYKELNDVDRNTTRLELPEGRNATYETVKLLASDSATNDHFGTSLSLSADNALVGAPEADDKGNNSGSVYYYKKLNEKTGMVNEDIKLLATDGAGGDWFGNSVSLDGDRFIIGAPGRQTYAGNAYAGDIRAFTTLDADNGTGTGTTLATDGLSFVSRTDWIIGATNANNTVTLTAGDTADITATDKAVYIGQTAGADNNTLHIEGTLTATTVYVGADGATGNTLRFTTAALDNLDIGTLYLDTGNFLEFENADHAIDHEDVAALLSGTTVRVRDSEGGWATLTGDNATTLLVKTVAEDATGGVWTRFTTFSATAVPEPAAYAALAGLTLLAIAATLRRFCSKRV
ncbi:MAG: FG-GAP repeat protein [Opitutaceae bacterium]|jgi:hypothetical protein|nr:FG-GAP repeat protein [Opitutaceae bacterium]